MMQLILGSDSPRRRELLAQLGHPFTVAASHAEELTGGYPPEELPQRNAVLKAQAVAKEHPDALVLGADTAIVFAGKLWGKPRDLEEARAFLLAFSGRMHQVITGVALCCKTQNLCEAWSAVSRVYFKPFDAATAERYIARVSVLDKAGAYAIQEAGDLLIDHYDGELENVVGLPLAQLKTRLAELLHC